jgi:hypothetical protein
VPDRNTSELDNGVKVARPPASGDEATNIQRGLGAKQNASGCGANANASVDGGLIVSLVALVFSVLALGLVWYFGTSMAVNAALAAERAEQSSVAARMAREYAVQVFPQLNRMGYPVRSPGEPDHYTAQPEDYEKVDNYIKQRSTEIEP